MIESLFGFCNLLWSVLAHDILSQAILWSEFTISHTAQRKVGFLQVQPETFACVLDVCVKTSHDRRSRRELTVSHDNACFVHYVPTRSALLLAERSRPRRTYGRWANSHRGVVLPRQLEPFPTARALSLDAFDASHPPLPEVDGNRNVCRSRRCCEMSRPIFFSPQKGNPTSLLPLRPRSDPPPFSRHNPTHPLHVSGADCNVKPGYHAVLANGRLGFGVRRVVVERDVVEVPNADGHVPVDLGP